MTDRQLPPVALVGMAVLLPGAADLDAYWRNLLDGADAITDVPEGRWDADYYRPGSATGPAVADQVYCRRGGFVDDLANVEVTRFGIMPNSVAGTEPDQLIALSVAAAAIADAGGEDRLPDRHRIGVVLGRGGYLTPGLVRLDQRVRTAGQLVRTLGELLPDLDRGQLDRVREAFTERLGPDSPESAIGLVPNLAASRVANRLDLRGPAYTIDAACASSLVAVDQAVGELASGRCDLMLAGGVHHCHDITLWSVFSQLRALSPSQRIRPFHRGADGILIGEGTGVVALKRLADAERDGDRIYAVIRGTGVASDGRAAGLVNPDPGGQAHAVRQAWRAAGLDPSQPGSIGLLEAHGTATPAGDAAELATLADVFGPGADGDRPVIGSVKSMIGHTMPAAGVAGLVKAALAVHHGMLLPTLHCDDPHPALAATRFRPLDKATPWETTAAQPVRRAAVNAFGFGGINAHVVLEQAPGATASPGFPTAPATVTAAVAVAEPERVLMLAADSPAHLAALLEADDPAVLAAGLDAERTHPQAGRTRLGIVDPTAKRLALARRAVARGRAWRGRGDVWFTPSPLLGSSEGKLAFVFPGLEGDFEPRVDDIAGHFGLAAPASPRSGEQARVGDVGRHGFGVVGVGRLLDSALRRMDIVPDAVAGHSVGEWTAMVAAGVYSGDAVGDFMASFDPDTVTVPGLAFGAIGASAERVLAELGGWADAGIVLSHDNAPSQSMVCGPVAAVDEFVRSFRAQGVLSQVLPFQSGFHTPMLAPYLGPITDAADGFRLHPPTVPLWSGTTASPYPEDEAAVRELFVRHLLEPVRFRQLIEAMYAAGHRAFVQVGTGQLGSLIGDTLGGRDHLVVAANSPHRTGLAQLRRVATALWTEGAAVAPGLAPARSAGPVRAARPAATRPPVRLDLGGALVSLGGQTLADLRAGLSGGRTPAALALQDVPVAGRAAVPAGVTVRAHAAVPGGLPVSGGAAVAGGAGGPLAAGGLPQLGGAPLPGGVPVAGGASVPGGALVPGGVPAPGGALLPGSAPVLAAAAFPAGAPSPLDALAGRFPAAAELSALLRDTADTAAALIAAGSRRHNAMVPASASARAPAASRAAPAGSQASRSWPGAAPPGAPRTAQDSPAPPAARTRPADALPGAPVPVAAPGQRQEWRTVVHVSPDTMPYLLDHCFFPQRPGWPDVADRWPVVPATTIVHHIMEAAQQAAPGMRAVAVHSARFDQWLTATPPVDVTVTAVADGPGRLAVSFGPRARATVELAARYPDALPAPWRTDPASERTPEHTAAQLYSERWMFHGPAFQGVTELTAIGDSHVRAVLTAPPAPGALLDNVGQVLGYWIMATRTERTVVFPVQMRQMRFYGPHPRPGTEMECLVRIASLTDTVLEADIQLVVEGEVWAELTGWQDRRFDNDPQTKPVERFPERNTLSRARPGGWSLCHERWPDLASRDLIMRNSLSGAERSAYEQHAPRGRRQWLLGRIAAKDAVRQWLWDHGEGPVFPAEIRVLNDEQGRPYVTGLHGRTLPPLDISVAHRAEAGVAIVRPHVPGPGPGIDIEEVTGRDAETLATALGEEELKLLQARCAATGESQALWFTRFWAAKEAVAKAEGTGFGGRPRDFSVLEAAPDRLLVSGRLERAYPVRCEQTGNPPGLPDRDYVVAWTTGPTDDDEESDQ
ncbi:type I polyketide synthase [Actinacidiphila oryziradicis]|uniref:4'-phosphopantetheinyl transferase superfamily protein n=1 Tax=Actinacidiphila oryziradicis TaxID=2571141 RepID=A0A4V5N027_9ACTN|nr:type I polyketide synthase [Actinacidiphila oryziradicis]TKA10429.1 4'-phosphopantetheinyl transferase superfamily protein [Actinacidiphila oryziradicis]